MAPAGFSFFFGAAAVRMHHLCRFSIFAQDMAKRTLLRRFVQQSCEIFGGDRLIYAPDEGIGEKILDLVTHNFTVADIENELLRLGPPAQTFDELNDRFGPPWARPVYYVDTFPDFSPRAMHPE